MAQINYDIYKITFRGSEKPVIQSNEDNLLANVAPVSETVMEETVEIKTMRLNTYSLNMRVMERLTSISNVVIHLKTST